MIRPPHDNKCLDLQHVQAIADRANDQAPITTEGIVFCSSNDRDTRIASTAPKELKIVQPRFSGPRSSYLSAVLNYFSTKRSILIGAGLDGIETSRCGPFTPRRIQQIVQSYRGLFFALMAGDQLDLCIR